MTTTTQAEPTLTDSREAAARRVLSERASETGPRVELVISTLAGMRLRRVTVPVRVADLTAGARECVGAGLLSVWSGDDASTIVYRTGRTVGEARAAQLADLRQRGPGWLAVYGSSIGPTDDPTPETALALHHSPWCAEKETPEEYLNRALGCYAGRVVRAGLRGANA